MRYEVMGLERWRSPASAYPREAIGRAAIKTGWYKQGGIYPCPAYGDGRPTHYEALKRLRITALTIDGDTWMVDDPAHWWAMEDHALAYGGHVVCAGLGLGLIVHALTARDEVERITVIERCQDVIDLVLPHLPQEKLDVICASWYNIGPADIGPVDGAFFDLYVGNAWEFISAGINDTVHMLDTWGRDVVTRVHGLPQGMILAGARATLDYFDLYGRREQPAYVWPIEGVR